jgi:hypothetical protein
MSTPHTQIDAALATLGEVPRDLGALIARYAGSDFELGHVDRMLEALGKHVAAPPNPSPTVVGMDVPAASPSKQGRDANMAAVEWAMDMPPRPPPSAAPAAVGVGTGAEPTLEAAHQAIAYEPSSQASSHTARHLPWESEAPAAAQRASTAPRELPTAPPDARSELDLAAAGSTQLAAALASDTPAAAASDAASTADSRRDTLEDGPIVTPTLPDAPARELAAAPGPSSATEQPAQSESREASPAAARPSEAPEVSTSDDDGDEFEIMVDDELLEIAEDDFVIVDDEEKS